MSYCEEQQERSVHRIAARLLGTDSGLLHHDLYETLTLADNRVRRASRHDGGQLRSRQVVAAIIAAWEMTHLNERVVGE